MHMICFMGKVELHSYYISLLWKSAFHPTHVLLGHQSITNLLLHFPCLFRAATKQKETGCQTIQPVYRP